MLARSRRRLRRWRKLSAEGLSIPGQDSQISRARFRPSDLDLGEPNLGHEHGLRAALDGVEVRQ
jgi:hypothetical protein